MTASRPRAAYTLNSFVTVCQLRFNSARRGGGSDDFGPKSDFKAIVPKEIVHAASADHVQAGLPIPKAARVQIFSPDDWEGFTEEWASSLTGYAIVRRFAGSGDMGLDVAGFTDAAGFSAPWDNYQCKRYDHPLRPADIHVEIGKIIYYSWLGEYTVPRRHYFAASRDVGTTAAKLQDALFRPLSCHWTTSSASI